jgi:hypothetical protein
VTTYPLSPEGLSLALRELDRESWELAEQLKAEGTKGTPMNECECIVAVHLRKVLPGATAVYVEAEAVRVEGSMRDEYGFDWPVVLSQRLPDGAQDLVQEFDKGEYPELIEEESNA